MSFEELLKSLQSEYLASLPEKIKSIRVHVLTPSPHELREAFHKLKGTGKTYGLPEVSDLSELVESVCLASPKLAAAAATPALSLLEEIYKARKAGRPFDVHQDPRFVEIRKLAQN